MTFKHFLDNKFLRILLQVLSGRCKHDDESRLKVALEMMVGRRKHACPVCECIVFPLVWFFITTIRKLMGISKKEFISTFERPYWLRGLVSTVKGIAKFGARMPFVPDAPYLVVWNVTNKCNLNCKHCYQNAGKRAPDELSTEKALQVVDMLADWGVTVLSFSGGEPLIRQDFLKVLKRAHDHGMYTAIATNGTLLTEDMCQELAKLIPNADHGYVEVSLDGATAETHDTFRGVPGAFERTVQGIKNALNAGLDVAIAPTVTRENYEEIDNIIEFANTLNVWRVMLFNFIPTGRGKEIAKKDLTPLQREKLLHKIIKWNYDESIKPEVESTAPQLARVAYQLAKEEKSETVKIATHMESPTVPSYLADVANFIGGCGAGRFYFALQPNGDVGPCVFIDKRLANIFNVNLQKFWEETPLFWLLRDKDIPEGCGDCEYRYICGGCRARSYGYFGTFTKPDIGCIRNKEAWDAYQESSE
ncbi:MAG: radical SAM protein [Candidatus Korarchaeota archaeon]|nr:radical SAM protein [Candidatus Korarchaeota archaeon]NIU83428.1 radical SAM protein [Candidatus Thorarchaeota archaeon]NIW13700.1 radical SAM protein [Candidatus Thorarchaeota archaeon]NIW51799.1 radical SAM protein [Candidatus Korarchaeota archaeon]